MTQALPGPLDASVDDDQDKQEDQHKQHAADEGDEPCLGGELLHVQVSAGAHVDGGHDGVGVHREHQGRGEGAVTLPSEGGGPDHVGLMQT